MACALGVRSSPKDPWSRSSAAAPDSWKPPERDPQDRRGRAAARTLPMWVGTGCRPSVTSPRLEGSDPRDRWGRAAARTLPMRVGTGCRPSVTSPRLEGSDPQDRWGRAAARTLPTRVGTGCRPSVTSPPRRHRQHAEASRDHGRIRAPPRWGFRLQAPGPHPMRGRMDAGSRTRYAPSERAVCDATPRRVQPGDTEHNSVPLPPTCPTLPITPDKETRSANLPPAGPFASLPRCASP